MIKRYLSKLLAIAVVSCLASPVFATVITLLLVPSLYMILDDLNRWSSPPDTAQAAKQATNAQGAQQI